jgi:isopenicillin N synthase-like dioxygenase
VSSAVIDSLLEYIPKLFALPQEAKDDIAMANSEHFLGYSKLGKELTKGKVDRREQFDFATPHISRWKEGDPDHYRLWGPSQVSSCDSSKPVLMQV